MLNGFLLHSCIIHLCTHWLPLVFFFTFPILISLNFKWGSIIWILCKEWDCIILYYNILDFPRVFFSSFNPFPHYLYLKRAQTPMRGWFWSHSTAQFFITIKIKMIGKGKSILISLFGKRFFIDLCYIIYLKNVRNSGYFYLRIG